MPAAQKSTRNHRAGMVIGLLGLGLASCQGKISGAGASGTGSTMGAGGDAPGAPGTGGNAGGAVIPGSGGAGGANPDGTGGMPSFGTCNPGAEPGVTPLQRLSALQYRNTVRDLLKASGLATLAEDVKPMLSTIPDDSTPSFRGLDARVSAAHVEGAYNVAAAIGNAIEATPARLTALAGACATATPLTMKCVDDLLASFGRRAFRRPLSTDDATNFRALNDGTRGPAETIRAIVVTLLMSPRFVNQVETEGQMQGNATLLKLDPYEVASRLSYTFWQTMPDDALLAAAADGSLSTDAGFNTQLERVFNDARTKTTLWQFWNEWFRLEAFTGFSSERPAFASLAKGENLGVTGHDHWSDMVTELHDLTDLYTWTRKGTLADLLTTDLSITRSADLAHLYGVAAWTGSGDYPKFASGTRMGILQRAGLLANSIETTNPFHRGSFVRRNILCDPLPRPDPNTLPPGSLDPPPPSPSDTTRQRFAKKVTSTLCSGCHTGFSDIGYTLEAFDALGRYRTTEKVYDEQDGHLVAELPLDTTAVPQVVMGDKQQVAGPAQLNQLIADSGKVATCLSGNYFRYALRREPTTGSGDACVYEQLDAQLRKPGVSLAEVFKALAQQTSFRQRKVGAP